LHITATVYLGNGTYTLSMKGEQEVICTLLNGDIADDLK